MSQSGNNKAVLVVQLLLFVVGIYRTLAVNSTIRINNDVFVLLGFSQPVSGAVPHKFEIHK